MVQTIVNIELWQKNKENKYFNILILLASKLKLGHGQQCYVEINKLLRQVTPQLEPISWCVDWQWLSNQNPRNW